MIVILFKSKSLFNGIVSIEFHNFGTFIGSTLKEIMVFLGKGILKRKISKLCVYSNFLSYDFGTYGHTEIEICNNIFRNV